LSKGDRVGQRGAAVDHRAIGFEVGARVEQRIENLDVIAAGGPVKRCLAVRAGERGVDVGSRGDQEAHRLPGVGEVPRPVRSDVQERR